MSNDTTFTDRAVEQHAVEPDKYILMHYDTYDTSAEGGDWIDKSAFVDDRLITPGGFPDYDNF